MQIYEVLQFYTKKMEKQKGVRDKVMREREREKSRATTTPKPKRAELSATLRSAYNHSIYLDTFF